MDSVSHLDIQQEGRITALEVKVLRIVNLTEDLHADMTARKARWSFLAEGIRYVAWLTAGAGALLGFSKSESVAGWISSFPTHH